MRFFLSSARRMLQAASVLIALTFALTQCNASKTDTAKTDTSATQSPHDSSQQGSSTNAMTANALPVYLPEIIRTIPHDTAAFTQGLCFHDGDLYESTGQYASSTLRKVDWQTGKVLKQTPVPSEYFAEGLAIVGGKAYQLTWRENTGLVYDVGTLKRTGSFSYYGEGWGLTYDGEHLIMSDGTNILRFLDPKDCSVKRTLFVTAPLPNGLGATAPLNRLNELEYVNGEIFANVWFSDSIARINPTTGKVSGWLDMRSLGNAADRRDENNVLNGIAYDAKRDVLLVTGKLWSNMYEVRLKPVEQPATR